MASKKNCSVVYSRIGIVGAGISGLAAAKHLSHHHPIVFEASDTIGGVWKHCSYKSTRLQTPRSDFEFSDYPWPERELSDFPTHNEVLDYLHGYATNFGLLKYVKLNSKVIEIRFTGELETGKFGQKHIDYGTLLTGEPVWEVAVKNNQSESLQWYAFEFVVICIGKYGDIPHIPAFPGHKGPEIFNGKVLHSLDYCKLNNEAAYQLLKGKKVVIVGYKKSAIDLAVECAEANKGPDGQPCTMVIRTVHWTVPSYDIWGLPFFLFYSTRLSQFIHERPNQTLWRTFICYLLSPLRKIISKIIESYLLWKLPLRKYGLVPSHPFLEDYASCQMAILPKTFFQEANEGRILFKKSSKWWFWDGGVEFDDKTKLEADVVVLATGFEGKKKLKSILPEPFSSLIADASSIIPLYRDSM
ncbi:hypothetical protein AQUCO_02000547v1 [Aquilegia coerulea]|uniref:Flavin-containing monooxygenase n=1 Tax=Aquilegia coerulea TaxID=218851 RepID=A0A2G5DI56_AQUCA|nr:hypothetical protein AQUCO_02000547v1 [Aquilegia coerulea]